MPYDKNLGKRLGMLTPSGNSCLEPVTSAIVAQVPDVSAHFSRFKVTGSGLDQASLDQFDIPVMLEAARLLADAKMDVIGWNGSSGAWMPGGPKIDQRLCEAIESDTGIPATTMTFAVWDAFKALGIQRYSLVTPFVDEMVDLIKGNFAEAGFTCVKSVNLPLEGTLAKDRVPPEEMRRLIEAAADPRADGIAIVCTNFRGAPLAEELERSLGVPIVDSVSATAWKCLEMIDIHPRIAGWGQLLRGERSAVGAPAGS